MDTKNTEKIEGAVVFNEGDDIVTGTEVVANSERGIDYAKLTEKFGCTPMT
jgi:hypothetical protein